MSDKLTNSPTDRRPGQREVSSPITLVATAFVNLYLPFLLPPPANTFTLCRERINMVPQVFGERLFVCMYVCVCLCIYLEVCCFFWFVFWRPVYPSIQYKQEKTNQNNIFKKGIEECELIYINIDR